MTTQAYREANNKLRHKLPGDLRDANLNGQWWSIPRRRIAKRAQIDAKRALIQSARLEQASDGINWAREVLGGRYPQAQREIFENISMYPKVAVAGCNGSGKDWTAARIALWWIHRYMDSRVVVTGPTNRQVQEVCFHEIREAFGSARQPSEISGKPLLTPMYTRGSSRPIVGVVANDPQNIKGLHSPHLMVIITEAQNYDREFYMKLLTFHPEKILMLGNTDVTSGVFYDIFNSEAGAGWHKQHIQVSDLPNFDGRLPKDYVQGMVTPEHANDLIEEYGEENDHVQAILYAQFPRHGGEDAVIPLTYVLEAANRPVEIDPSAPSILGVDLAAFGGNANVAYIRQGRHAKEVYRKVKADGMEVVNDLVKLAQEYNIDTMVVDGNGVGYGIWSRLEELRDTKVLRVQKLINFVAGSRPQNKSDYMNSMTECWFKIKNWLSDSAHLDGGEIIRIDLTARRYERALNGKFKLAPKLTATSPDAGDALAMTMVEAPASFIYTI